jgi:hypothetical protein
MIAHVAEVSEQSGRVVVWLDPQSSVVSASLNVSSRIASAYGARLETVVVGGIDLSDAGDLPIRRVGHDGTSTAAFGVTNAAKLLTERHRCAADRMGAALLVPVTHTGVSGDALDRLADMCSAEGPWNLIALTRAPTAELGPIISDILANVSGVTGVIVGGRDEQARSDDILVAIEDAERMPSMLRAAERLVTGNGRIRMMIVAVTAAQHSEIDSLARLAAQGNARVVFDAAGPTHGVDGALDARIFKARAGLVIARFGGTLLAHGRALARTMALAHAPFLLVR